MRPYPATNNSSTPLGGTARDGNTNEVWGAPRRPIRVLRVVDRLGYGMQPHGVGRLWLNSLLVFVGTDCDVIPCVLRLSDELAAQFQQRGIRLHHLKKGRFDPSTIWTLCRFIRRERINVLHLEGFGASTFGRIAGALTGTPAILHVHDMYTRTPWYVRLFDRCLAPATANIIAVSRPVAAACVQRLHIPRQRVAVVPNGVEAQWATPVSPNQIAQLRVRLNIPATARVIGSVTRFHQQKDVPTFLEAVAHLRANGRACHAVIVGDGPDRAQIEQHMVRLGLQDLVHLAGFQADVRPFFALMEITVFSSLSDEGCPLALLEAMAMGRAVVATAVNGVMDIVRHEANGLLVPVKDAEAMAGAIARFLDDRALEERVVAQAQQDIAVYQIPAHAERIRQVYREALRRRPLDN